MVEEGGLPLKFGANGVPDKVSGPKEQRIIHGRTYIFEEAITGDFALVKAWKGDKLGNLIFRFYFLSKLLFEHAFCSMGALCS